MVRVDKHQPKYVLWMVSLQGCPDTLGSTVQGRLAFRGSRGQRAVCGRASLLIVRSRLAQEHQVPFAQRLVQTLASGD